MAKFYSQSTSFPRTNVQWKRHSDPRWGPDIYGACMGQCADAQAYRFARFLLKHVSDLSVVLNKQLTAVMFKYRVLEKAKLVAQQLFYFI